MYFSGEKSPDSRLSQPARHSKKASFFVHRYFFNTQNEKTILLIFRHKQIFIPKQICLSGGTRIFLLKNRYARLSQPARVPPERHICFSIYSKSKNKQYSFFGFKLINTKKYFFSKCKSPKQYIL